MSTESRLEVEAQIAANISEILGFSKLDALPEPIFTERSNAFNFQENINASDSGTQPQSIVSFH